MSQKTAAVAKLISTLDEKWWEKGRPAKYSGAAAAAQIGPKLGSSNIYVIKDAFLLQVSLPGVTIENDGITRISGINTMRCPFTDEFEKVTDNLCPEGEFSISIQLSGPADPTKFIVLKNDLGVLEIAIGRK